MFFKRKVSPKDPPDVIAQLHSRMVAAEAVNKMKHTAEGQVADMSLLLYLIPVENSPGAWTVVATGLPMSLVGSSETVGSHKFATYLNAREYFDSLVTRYNLERRE